MCSYFERHFAFSLQDALSILKQKAEMVIEENARLHDQLRSQIVNDMDFVDVSGNKELSDQEVRPTHISSLLYIHGESYQGSLRSVEPDAHNQKPWTPVLKLVLTMPVMSTEQ